MSRDRSSAEAAEVAEVAVAAVGAAPASAPSRAAVAGPAAAALLALAAGALHALSLADPLAGRAHGWLQIASLAVLVRLLRGAQGGRRTWRRGLLIGGCFGLAWLCGTFWWLFISMHTYGGLAAPLAVAAVVGLAAFLSTYYAVACGAFTALAPASPARAAMFFAALWTLAELARGTLFTGFPWGAGGYAHVDGVLAFLPRYVGVYGLGFVAAGIAALLALGGKPAWRTWRTWRRPWPVAALTLALSAGLWAERFCAVHLCYTPPPGTPRLMMEVALLQGNIPQDEKFVAGTGVADSLRWYGEQLAQSTAPLVVAPETAIPLLPAQLPPHYWAGLRARFAGRQQAALLGIPLGSYEAGYTNSVLGLAPGAAAAAPYRYDKHHLVPFGEFIPPLFRWFVELMHIPLGDFARGAVGQPSFAWQGQRLAPNICYEDLFGEELAARFIEPAKAPTAFVNVGNIGWFGNTVAIDQHLAISRMRALEFERPMLRATNTGATAIIDHRGAVTHLLARHTRGVLTGAFEGRTPITPFAWWAARFGQWPLAAWCALLVAFCALARRAPRALRATP